jgi:hypothetical protein
LLKIITIDWREGNKWILVTSLYLNYLKDMDVMLYSGQCVIYFHIEQIFVLHIYVVMSNMYSEGNIKMEIL